MENNNVIGASLSIYSLKYRPNQGEVSFEVTVNNDSDRFANFQLELIAAGEIRKSDYRWYRLEPEVAAAKPPGSTTKFQVFIFNTPIPSFVGTVNLTVKIFSPQLGRERRLPLRLEIERDDKPIFLSVELPIRTFQVYPGNSVNIPVRVRNQGQVASNVLLRFTGVDSSWVTNSAERRFTIDAGSQTEVSFQCQPPSVVQAPSQNYVFTVEATSNNSYPADAKGYLEVLPVGFINFSVPQPRQRIPQRRPWLPDWKSKTASYELLFKNSSNLRQEIEVQLQGRDWRKCTFKKFPEVANLNLAETAKVVLEATTKRFWMGFRKTLFLEARAELSDQRLGSTDPATHSLELEVLPIIPLWLQSLIIALIVLLIVFIFRERAISHTASVNSVDINGTVSSVVSASDDCTLRFWRLDKNSIQPDETKTSQNTVACNNVSHRPKGLFGIADSAIQVARFEPVQNQSVAIGLQNGVIEIREVATGNTISELVDNTSPKNTGDRVSDLVFTSNSLSLFSGSGKGKVRRWSRATINEKFPSKPDEVIELEKQQKLERFPISAVALSPDDKLLVVSGNFNRFLILPQDKNSQFKPLSLQNIYGRGGVDDSILALAFIPKPLNSQQKILATSDTAGFIKIWDLNPSKCKSDSSANNSSPINILNCKPLDSWQDESSKAGISSIAFSPDGSSLVSGGREGRVILWHLNSDHTLDRKNSPTINSKTIYESPTRNGINSITFKQNQNQNVIVIGTKDSQVIRLNPN